MNIKKKSKKLRRLAVKVLAVEMYLLLPTLLLIGVINITLEKILISNSIEKQIQILIEVPIADETAVMATTAALTTELVQLSVNVINIGEKNQLEIQPNPIEEELENQWVDKGIFKVTAYCACPKCCGKNAQGITATGTHVRENHTVAVDPNVIPLGSTISINGHVYVAEDTGNLVIDNTIDLYIASHEQAENWGVQYLNVYVMH